MHMGEGAYGIAGVDERGPGFDLLADERACAQLTSAPLFWSVLAGWLLFLFRHMLVLDHTYAGCSMVHSEDRSSSLLRRQRRRPMPGGYS